jgi:hypothetical protein
MFRHILAVLCEMFSITRIMTDGYVEEDPLHGLHARLTWILCIFTYENTWKPFCTQLLLTTKRHFTISLWMPVRLSAIAPAFLYGCGGPWWDVSRLALNLMEDILNTYYTCTLSGTTHKLNVSGHMLIWIFSFSWYVELVLKICLHLSVTPYIYSYIQNEIYNSI